MHAALRMKTHIRPKNRPGPPFANGNRENMGIEVDVKRKFVVNGEEYASLDALPSDIRETLQKTLKEDKSRVEVNIDTSIVFNGKEYTGADQMPAETRQAYEKVMKAAGTGDFASHALGGIGSPARGRRRRFQLMQSSRVRLFPSPSALSSPYLSS